MEEKEGAEVCALALAWFDWGDDSAQDPHRPTPTPDTPQTTTAVRFRRDPPAFKVPNLTIKDLLSAIPAHCFERPFKSFFSLSIDLIKVSALAYAGTYIDTLLNSVDFSSSPLNPSGFISPATQFSLARFIAWAFWSFWQGLVFTGIWVVAHECGHQAFSPSMTINNAVGWVLHSALMVPYHSWRIFHARHHAGTGHLTLEEVFVPRTRAQRGLKNLRPLLTDEDEDIKAALKAAAKTDTVIIQRNGKQKRIEALIRRAA